MTAQHLVPAFLLLALAVTLWTLRRVLIGRDSGQVPDKAQPLPPDGTPPKVIVTRSGPTVALLLGMGLVLLPACAVTGRTDKLNAALDENAADLRAFGKWNDEREDKIVANCKAKNVGPDRCKKRLQGYFETRDHLRALLKKQIVSLDLAVSLIGRDPDASLATPEPAPVTGRSVP